MAEVLSGLEREITRIVRQEVARSLSPLTNALAALGGSAQAAIRVTPSGRPARGRAKRAAGAAVAATWTAEAIRGLRSTLGLTQAAFGKKVGVTPVAVYQWESGRSRPRAASLRQLTKAAEGHAGAPPETTAASRPKRRRRPRSSKRG